jgi:beta-glucanase (GH16 family)
MNARRVTRSVLWVVLGLGFAGFARCGDEPRWNLVWADEFDGPAGQPPDPFSWTPEVGRGPGLSCPASSCQGGWGNHELEFYTARPENASLDGQGHLAIWAIRESYQGSSYTSARLISKGLVERTHGRFEARLKLPSGQGLWPAFWLLGADLDVNTWPACGEIDIMEYRGQETQRVTGSLHGPGYSGGAALTGNRDLAGSATFDQDFHVFAVEWTPDWIAWELDGVIWQVITPSSMPANGRWVFDHPFFVILNLAVGGDYVGAPDPSVFPQTMLVDYVRVYELAK